MQFDREHQLRIRAKNLRDHGIVTWADELRVNGLDPYFWSTGGRTMIPAPDGYRPAGPAVRYAGGPQFAKRLSPLAAQSFDAESNTVDVLWSTGAGVLRQDYEGTFNEVLDMAATSVRLGRLNAGAPFCNSHSTYDLGDVIGSVVPGSARVAGGKGTCRVLLATSADCADVVSKITTGVIRNVSVGYIIHGTTWTEKGGVRTCRVTDWEPIEISAVAIPADPGAQIRRA